MSTDVSINTEKKIIPGPKGKFFTGNLSQINFASFHQYLKEKAFEFGPIYRLAFAHKPVVVLSDPVIVSSILKNRPDKYRRLSSIQAVFSELGINGVFSSEGEEWKIQRKLMNQAFKSGQLETYYPIIRNSTARLQDVMNGLSDEGTPVNFQALLQRYTVDITTNLAFGYDMNSLNNRDTEFQQQINVVFPMISDRIKAPFPYWRYFKMKKDKQLDSAIDFIKQQCENFITAAEKNINSGKSPANILEAMICAQDEDGNGFTQQQIFPNVLTLLLAGEDTTANTLGWVIHYLTEHPVYQDKICHEIESKLASLDLNSPASLNEFPLLNASIQEAMRMMPVAPLIYLENKATENILGFDVAADTMIIILLSQSGHCSDVFDKPEQFIPERWLNADAEEQKKNMKYLMHFGGGARQCPGMQLSFMEMKCALVMLLKEFTFSRDINNGRTENLFALTVMPKNLMISIKRRESEIKTTEGNDTLSV